MSPVTDSLLPDLRRCFDGIYGDRLRKIVLFGSHARGDADPSSDVDILVVLAGEVFPSEEIGRVGSATARFSLQHDVVISCVFVSESRYNREQSPLLINIRREGIAA